MNNEAINLYTARHCARFFQKNSLYKGVYRKKIPNAILGIDKSYIVCIKGSLVCTTSCPKTVGRILSAIPFCSCTKSSMTIPCCTENSLCVPYLSVNNDWSLLPADTLTYQTQLSLRSPSDNSPVGPGIR